MKEEISSFRTAIPPWRGLDSPLIRHEIRPELRTGLGLTRAFFVAFALGCVLLYLIFPEIVLSLPFFWRNEVEQAGEA
jgi:hypothetical protein